MLSLLRTGRWLAFTATALAAIIAFGLLSLWQWHRAEEKRAEFAPIAAALAAEPVALRPAQGTNGQAQGAQLEGLDGLQEWRRVTLTGRFDPEGQWLVRNRPQDGTNGFQVVSRFVTVSGADVWVVRGFQPATGAAAAAAEAPEPPAGELTVTGHLRGSDPAPARPAADLPQSQVAAINTADLDALAAVTTGSWYVLATSDPTLKPVPLPEPSDVRNLSYAGQWLLFAAIVIGGWWFFLRREAREDAELQAGDPVHPLATRS